MLFDRILSEYIAMTKDASPSNRDLYQALDRMRQEFKADLITATSQLSANQGRLEKKFDDLEAGRLTRVESKQAELEATVGINRTKIAFMVATATIVTNVILGVTVAVISKRI